jgi:hypothetical protein
MKRISPRVRAQFNSKRQPVTMFLIGMALAGPAGAFLIREDGANRAAKQSMYVPALPSTGDAEALTVSLAKMFNVPLDLAKEITTAAEREGIAPRLAFGLVRTESRFKAAAVSPVGAIGLTQVMPGTAKWLDPKVSRSDLFVPSTNLRLGFGYLRKLMDQYNGDVRMALTAYNRGPGTVRKAVRNRQNPDNGYADLVLRDASLPKTRLMNAHTSTGGRSSLIRAKMARGSKASVSRSSKGKTFKASSVRRSTVKAPARKATFKKASVKKPSLKKAPAKKTVKKAAAKASPKQKVTLPAPPKIEIPEPRIS